MNDETIQEQIENWLKIGMSYTLLSEHFYFDKRDNQFFSILITDYFIFDDKFEINKNTTVNYSQSTLELMSDRIQRIENDDNSILDIPRFGQVNEEELLSKIDSFLNLNAINIENTSIWNIENTSEVTIDLRDEKLKKWWEFWK